MKKKKLLKKRWINLGHNFVVFVGGGKRLGRVSLCCNNWNWKEGYWRGGGELYWRGTYYYQAPGKNFSHRYQAKRWVELMHEKWGLWGKYEEKTEIS